MCTFVCACKMTKVTHTVLTLFCLCLITSQLSTPNSHIHLGESSESVHDVYHGSNILCSVWKIPLILSKKCRYY